MSTNVSYIRMGSAGKDGKPEVSIPLVPAQNGEVISLRKHHTDHTLLRFLAAACALMAVVIVGLSLTVGYALITDSNQHGTIDRQQATITQLDGRVDQLEKQVQILEQRK